MPVKQELDILHDLETAKFITSSLRGLSALELKRYRERFERNATFYTELQILYYLVRQIAKRRGKQAVLPKTTGGVLYVAFTSNKHFYGSLNNDVMWEFLKKTGTDDDCCIIGQTGSIFWKKYGKKRKLLEYITFAQDTPTRQEMLDFLAKVAQYAQVFVFYPGFVSVIKQQVQSLDITYSEAPKEESPIMTLDYILEPEIAGMSYFFETQVRLLLFERMLLETQLSRVAARLIKMDTADENAGAMIKKQRTKVNRAYGALSNTRLLEIFSSYLQWKKHHR
jgi:ATP synthase F1 gamma subunit